MADYRAIASVGLTIVGLIEAETSALFPSSLTGVSCRLVQGKEFQNEDPVVPGGRGVSVYLYRVALNANRRNSTPRQLPDGTRLPAPLALDLSYLVTAWWDGTMQGASLGASREQQWLLALAFRALEGCPTVGAGLLNHYANASVFRDDETIDLIGEVLPPADLVSIWEVNKARMQPSATYLARGVMIEMDSEQTSGAPVQFRQFELSGTVGP